MTFVDLAKDKYYIKRQKSSSHMHFINFVKNEVDLKKKIKNIQTSCDRLIRYEIRKLR